MGKKTLLGLMQDFYDKIDLGHRIEHCNPSNKVKIKRYAKKKRHFSGLLFFLSILVYGGTHRCDDTWSNIYYKGKKTLLGLMHDIHDKIDLGHRIEHCNSTNKVKIKRCARKNRHFYGLLFFLSILVCGGLRRYDDTY